MNFDIDSYKIRTDRLRWDDIDLASFAEAPLDAASLRCLRYMHDVEFHTICYLRDLLVGPSHSVPDVTEFLSCWAYEELWHGEAIAKVLSAHGEPSGRTRVESMRRRLAMKEALRPLAMMLGSAFAGRSFLGIHMAWGAINEWTTQAGYAQLAQRAKHPVLQALLKRIMRQEGRHIDFYASQAEVRLRASGHARCLARFALDKFWNPVGSGVMPKEETRHLATHLFGDEAGMEAARRIDRRIDRLPGLDGLHLVEQSITSLTAAA